MFMSVTGIRRLPGADIDVEDFKSQLKKRRPRDVVGLLQSLTQGSDSGSMKWSDIGEQIEDVIGNLTDDIVNTLTVENNASQANTDLYMNTFAYWTDARVAAEAAALTAEDQLEQAVTAEETLAGHFHTNVSVWATAMKAIAQPCWEQQQVMDPSFTLNPQTVFTCDFSETNENVSSHCGKAETDFETNSTGEVTKLKNDLANQKEDYEEWKGYCGGNITDANAAYDATVTVYNLWVDARNLVNTRYNERKAIVCPSTPTYSCTGENGKIIKGLNHFVQQELVAGDMADSDESAVLSVNKSLSLNDRNYELTSLNIVHCLLTQLKSFGKATDGTYDNEDISTTVSLCSVRSTGDNGETNWPYTNFTIKFETNDNEQFEDTVLTPCVPTMATTANADGTTYSTLKDNSYWNENKVGTVNVGSATVISKYSDTGIPRVLNGVVATASEWASGTGSETVDNAYDSYFFPATSAQYLDYHKYNPRTGFECTAGGSKSLRYGNLAALSAAKQVVPTSYTESSFQRSFTVSGITDC